MNILLIGYEGYVGAGLYKYLKINHNVIGIGRKDDILNITEDLLEKNSIDVIINCATVMDRISPFFDIESLTYRVNIEGVKHVANLIKNTDLHYI